MVYLRTVRPCSAYRRPGLQVLLRQVSGTTSGVISGPNPRIEHPESWRDSRLHGRSGTPPPEEAPLHGAVKLSERLLSRNNSTCLRDGYNPTMVTSHGPEMVQGFTELALKKRAAIGRGFSFGSLQFVSCLNISVPLFLCFLGVQHF
jgi:hypothetical protein